jgi:hypothetical protein
VALDKSEVSAKGKLLLGGALESALEATEYRYPIQERPRNRYGYERIIKNAG